VPEAARRATLAALFAAAAVVACGGSGGGGGGGVLPPPGPPPGPIAWGDATVLATNATGVTAPAATIGATGTAAVLWSQIGLLLPGTMAPSAVPLVAAAENAGTTGSAAWAALTVVEMPPGTAAANDVVSGLAARQTAGAASAVWARAQPGIVTRLRQTQREASGWSDDPIDAVAAATTVQALTFAAAGGSAVRAAAWVEADATTSTVWASLRAPGVGWSQKVQLSAAGQLASAPSIAVDDSGNVLAVWREAGSAVANGRIWSRSLASGSAAWSIAAPVTDAGSPDSDRPQVVATSTATQFMAAWEQRGLGNLYDIRAARSTSLTTWPALTTLLEQNQLGDALEVRLTASGTGRVYAAWWQNNRLWFNRFGGLNWDLAASELSVAEVGTVRAPQIAADANGNFIAVWRRTAGALDDLYYTYYRLSDSTLSPPALLETGAGAVSSPALAVNASGAAVVAWLQAVAGQTNPNLVARLYRP
jgi:hypothetical protein